MAKRIKWNEDFDEMIKDNILLYGVNPGIRKSVMDISKFVHNNYRRRKKAKYLINPSDWKGSIELKSVTVINSPTNKEEA